PELGARRRVSAAPPCARRGSAARRRALRIGREGKAMSKSVNGTGHTELPIPNGWFAVAWSKDFVPGDVKRARYFGQDLVLFRTRDGHMRVLDAYCPHLGAHLAEGGRVV